jgi:hypothetical protein
MYRDDDIARTERATALIDEIAELERQQLAQAANARRLEAARMELSALQPQEDAPPRSPGLAAHVAVFATAAVVAFLGYAAVAARW